VHFFLQAT